MRLTSNTDLRRGSILRLDLTTSRRMSIAISVLVAVLVAPAFLALGADTAHADRGSIPFKPNVKIFEPNQRAMIAWNGEEEILLLTTDLRASEPTKVLEVIPLPSKPEVKEGDIGIIRRATNLINIRLPMQDGITVMATRSPAAKREPAGEVTFRDTIGAHDISITRVLDSDGFIEWVEDYLASAGADNPTIPAPLKDVVSEYLDEGFTWLVFDVISLDQETKTNDAIQYRFMTDFLFYPVKITRTEVGPTTIDLLILTRRLLNHFQGIPASRIRLPHEPITVSRREMFTVSQEMTDLLGRPESAKLRIWQIRGELSSFESDLVAW